MLKRTWFLSLVAIAVLTVLGCAGGTTTVEAEPSTEKAAASESSEDETRIAPAFTLPRVGGGEVSLADSAGRIRLVDFWTTWCAPCREEIPMLNELQTLYGEQGLDILAISAEDASILEEFLAENPVEYTSLVGTDELEQEYGAVGYPTAFLIDGEGQIVEFFFGPKPRSVLEKKIQELLPAS